MMLQIFYMNKALLMYLHRLFFFVCGQQFVQKFPQKSNENYQKLKVFQLFQARYSYTHEHIILHKLFFDLEIQIFFFLFLHFLKVFYNPY